MKNGFFGNNQALAMHSGGRMQHLRNLFDGVASLLGAFAPREYPAYKGFEQDAKQMREDWRNLGADMRATMKREKYSRSRTHGK